MTVQEIWKKFREEKNLQEDIAYEAWQFEGAPDELAKLVLDGVKTATCSLYYWYKVEGEPLPAVGEYSVILNSKDEPVCIIQTRNVNIVPFNLATEEHAYKEGEGDRSYEYWKKVHVDFFSNELAEVNMKFTEDMEIVCEEFKVVYRA
ncbi:MAG: ASCH domain-containing protein [Eubacteriales bacterium]|nr:ASCH domain-containing protein [Eubacteriales bacterium]